MKAEFYLVIGAEVRDTPRYKSISFSRVQALKKKPRTGPHEIAVHMALEFPDHLFTRPTINLSAAIPDSGTGQFDLSADMAEGIEEAIRQQTGLSVHIAAPEEES